MSIKIAIVSTPSIEVAESIAQAIVSERLAACVNIIPGATSLYIWQGSLHKESEAILVIKSLESALSNLEARIVELHPYDTPEFIVVDTEYANKKYEAWVQTSIGKQEI